MIAAAISCPVCRHVVEESDDGRWYCYIEKCECDCLVQLYLATRTNERDLALLVRQVRDEHRARFLQDREAENSWIGYARTLLERAASHNSLAEGGRIS